MTDIQKIAQEIKTDYEAIEQSFEQLKEKNQRKNLELVELQNEIRGLREKVDLLCYLVKSEK